MDEKILNLAYALKQSIEQHVEVVKLNTIEEQLTNDPTFLTLQKTYKDAEINLNELYERSYQTSAEEVALKQALFVAKQNLDQYALVRQYYAQYKVVKQLYEQVNQEIFAPLCGSEGTVCFHK